MSDGSDKKTKKEEGSLGSCVLCGKSAVHDFRPFCSKRCKDVDLGHWMTDRYFIAGEEEEEKRLEESDPPIH